MENSDVRISSIFILNLYLRNYTIEDMEREIVRSNKINAQDVVKKEEGKKPTDLDELEIIVIEGDGNLDDDIIIQETSVED